MQPILLGSLTQPSVVDLRRESTSLFLMNLRARRCSSSVPLRLRIISVTQTSMSCQNTPKGKSSFKFSYSGSDITAVVKEALMMPVRQCQRAKQFKRTPSGGYIPCAPSDPHAEKMTLMDIPNPSLARVPDVSKVRNR